MRRGGIQHQMPTQREITVAPDRFEVAADDAILITELRSAIAVCVYDAVEEAGALLHLRCIVRGDLKAVGRDGYFPLGGHLMLYTVTSHVSALPGSQTMTCSTLRCVEYGNPEAWT